jgi:NTP pyrophosphatase (non-canonical NTP hydrolase)
MSIVDVPPVVLSFEDFSLINMVRHLNWPRNGNGKLPPSHEWNLSDWAVAVAEEAGEVCGAVKRFNRIEAGHVINGKPNDVTTQEEALLKLQKEIGDTVTYLDLLAQHIGSSLGECTRVAFNGVSEREGMPYRV